MFDGACGIVKFHGSWVHGLSQGSGVGKLCVRLQNLEDVDTYTQAAEEEDRNNSGQTL